MPSTLSVKSCFSKRGQSVLVLLLQEIQQHQLDHWIYNCVAYPHVYITDIVYLLDVLVVIVYMSY